MKKHPSQPVEFVGTVLRFKENKIVDYMLEEGTKAGIFDLNKIASMRAQGLFDLDDYDQLTQLIGYSVSGYWSLSTSDKRRAARSQKKGMKLKEQMKELE